MFLAFDNVFFFSFTLNDLNRTLILVEELHFISLIVDSKVIRARPHKSISLLCLRRFMKYHQLSGEESNGIEHR